MSYEQLIDKKDKARFTKISCSNILDISLITPNAYENRYINKEIILNQIQVLDANILSIKRLATTLQIQIHSLNTNDKLSCTIFNYKSFHLLSFRENTRVYLLGKIFVNKQGYLEIAQPKIIQKKDINVIYAKYNSIVSKNLIAKYLNENNLLSYGIDTKIAKNIMQIHNPTIEFIQKYQISNSFYEDDLREYLHALKFVEIFNYLLKLKSKKKEFLSIQKLENNIDNWIESLPFKLTKDQLSSIRDIQKDFISPRASRRIIVGDVGSGKSMVIFACALMAYPNKSILMAPTVILAHQLHKEAIKFIGSFMEIALVTTSTKEVSSRANLIIGTHALLHKKLKNISLIMIDEQHKFGSNQRQTIESFSKKGDKRAHFLQFSATPIPRTMAMIESNLVDFSFIKTTPFEKNIQTKQIFKKDFKELLLHIQEQIKNNHQTIIVYPLVSSSEKIDYSSIEEAKDFWTKNFDKVYATHGGDKNKNEILEGFSKDGHILLATTLIEVGLSLPKLSTIVIVGAERLGLASLHQLRGRVSRTGILGYCFLYSNTPSKRLENFSHIKSGFDVAELDLKYRESGDIIDGTKQSGKMFEFINLSEDGDIIQSANESYDKI